jgi:hypothetical protein
MDPAAGRYRQMTAKVDVGMISETGASVSMRCGCGEPESKALDLKCEINSMIRIAGG